MTWSRKIAVLTLLSLGGGTAHAQWQTPVSSVPAVATTQSDEGRIPSPLLEWP